MKSGVRPKDPETIAALQAAARSRAAALEAEGKRTEAFRAYYARGPGLSRSRRRLQRRGRRKAGRGARPPPRGPGCAQGGAPPRRARRGDAALGQHPAPQRALSAGPSGSDPARGGPRHPGAAPEGGLRGLPRGAALRRAHPREPPRPDGLLPSRGDALPAGPDAGARPPARAGRDRPARTRSSYYNVACIPARSGDAARAIKDLEHAVEKGFTRFELIDTDTDFDPIRQRRGVPEMARGRAARDAGSGDSLAFAGDPDQAPHARALPQLPDEDRDDHPRQRRRGGVEHHRDRTREQRKGVPDRLEERRTPRRPGGRPPARRSRR